jgi:hypothetical protein
LLDKIKRNIINTRNAFTGQSEHDDIKPKYFNEAGNKNLHTKSLKKNTSLVGKRLYPKKEEGARGSSLFWNDSQGQ